MLEDSCMLAAGTMFSHCVFVNSHQKNCAFCTLWLYCCMRHHKTLPAYAQQCTNFWQQLPCHTKAIQTKHQCHEACVVQEGKTGGRLQQAHNSEHAGPGTVLVVEDMTADANQDALLSDAAEATQGVSGKLDVEHSDSHIASCSTASEQLTGAADESSLDLRLVSNPLQHQTSTIASASIFAVHGCAPAC